MLILVTGVPGTGKTSIARVLCKRLNAEEIDLKDLAVKGHFLGGYDTKRKSMIIDEKKISAAVKKHLKKNKNYVIGSHLAHFVGPKLVKLCVVLRCSPDVLKRRLLRRGYDHSKVYENIACEYLDSILIEAVELGHEKHLHEIDTSHKHAENVAEEIISVLKGKTKKSFGKIVWIR
jgi:adenylate kinase